MSVDRLLEHRRVWTRKPVLEPVYRAWFDGVLRELPAGARVLEVGSGPGFFADHAGRARPDLRWISSDLLATPWNSLAADALKLPVRAQSLDAVVGLDFIHHLAWPADFFREAVRVLRPSGRLVAVEPWITPLSYPVYRFLHHERCRMGLDPWTPFPDGPTKDAFDGDSALVYALVRRTPPGRWRDLGLSPPEPWLLNGFAYLATGGFKPGPSAPAAIVRALLNVDDRTRARARWTGLRARLVWRRAAAPGPP